MLPRWDVEQGKVLLPMHNLLMHMVQAPFKQLDVENLRHHKDKLQCLLWGVELDSIHHQHLHLAQVHSIRLERHRPQSTAQQDAGMVNLP